MQVLRTTYTNAQAVAPAFDQPDRIPTRARRYARMKRGLDVTLGLCFSPLFLLLIALVWALVRLDGGPGFFGHVRVGRGGKCFKCWKIRTMVPNADLALRDVLRRDPNAAEEWARDRKLTRDPRITWVGGFLRRSSLDELPQLWNVLRGEMSLVGPRPITPEELPRYSVHRADYCSVRPGLTGLWQVSGRSELSYQDRVALDVSYLQNMSLASDLLILLKTVRVVFRRDGV